MPSRIRLTLAATLVATLLVGCAHDKDGATAQGSARSPEAVKGASRFTRERNRTN